MRPTFPECCFTCEHRAVDTEMGIVGSESYRKEETYCGLNGVPSHVGSVKFKSMLDMVLNVCGGYERSWGKEQYYRQLLGLPELPQEFWPYGIERKNDGVREALRKEYAKAEREGYLLKPEYEMQIWNGEGKPVHACPVCHMSYSSEAQAGFCSREHGVDPKGMK